MLLIYCLLRTQLLQPVIGLLHIPDHDFNGINRKMKWIEKAKNQTKPKKKPQKTATKKTPTNKHKQQPTINPKFSNNLVEFLERLTEHVC